MTPFSVKFDEGSFSKISEFLNGLPDFCGGDRLFKRCAYAWCILWPEPLISPSDDFRPMIEAGYSSNGYGCWVLILSRGGYYLLAGNDLILTWLISSLGGLLAWLTLLRFTVETAAGRGDGFSCTYEARVIGDFD